MATTTSIASSPSSPTDTANKMTQHLTISHDPDASLDEFEVAGCSPSASKRPKISRAGSGDDCQDRMADEECCSGINECSSDHRCGSARQEDEDESAFDWPSKRTSPQIDQWLTIFERWTHQERIGALDELMKSGLCDVQIIRHLLTVIEPQLQRDFIYLLPKELALYILSFLEPRDLLRASQTCRYWRVLCEDNLLWREKCREEQLLDDNETISEFFRRRLPTANPPRQPQVQYSTSTSLGCQLSNCSLRIASKAFSGPSTDCPPAATASVPNPSSQLPTVSHHHHPHHHHDHNKRHEIPPFSRSDFKMAYLRQKAIEYNWRYGQFNSSSEMIDGTLETTNHNPIVPTQPQACLVQQQNQAQNKSNDTHSSLTSTPKKQPKLRPILQLKGHDDHVITCLQFNPASNIIVSGSDDNTLKVWSSETGACLKTLTGHTGGVWSSQLSPENIVISGSTDRTLKVWDAIKGTCLHTLYGHTSTVRCMALHGSEVVSGSRDATLRIWDIHTGECKHVLSGHVAAVRCVQYNGKLVVSGAYDYLVKVWDAATETCLHTLEGHTNRVYSLQFDGEHIVSGSLDTSIRVWSASQGKLRHTLIGHQSLTSGMQLGGNILVSGNADSTVKVWDITTGQCLQTLAGANKHQSAVTCLQFNNRFVITSSDDGTVKLWDLKTGEFVRNLVSLSSGGSGGVVWRIRASNTKLVCAVGSRNGTEETKLLVLDFDVPEPLDAAYGGNS